MHHEEETKSIIQPRDINKTIEVKQPVALPQQADSKLKSSLSTAPTQNSPQTMKTILNNELTMT